MAEAPRGLLRLVLVSPGDRTAAATAQLVERSLAGGVTAVLLREPGLGPDERRDLATGVAAACRRAGALLLVHRDPRLALDVGADGVHLGHGSPPTDEVRRRAPGLLVGRSAHWPLGDDDRSADYLTLSPFAPTHRSRPRPLLSAGQVRAVLAEPGLPPVVALGGLDAERVPGLPRGLAGVAVIRALADAPDPREAAVRLRAAVERIGAGSP